MGTLQHGVQGSQARWASDPPSPASFPPTWQRAVAVPPICREERPSLWEGDEDFISCLNSYWFTMGPLSQHYYTVNMKRKMSSPPWAATGRHGKPPLLSGSPDALRQA